MSHTTLPWPRTLLPRVFHVGSLNAADKGRQGQSLEGHGLSVSLHPEEWTRIARLGGYPTWRLSRRGGQFLAYHQLSAQHREVLTQWAVDAGYLVRTPVWEVRWYDSELDDIVMSQYDREADAQREYDFMAEEEHEGISLTPRVTGRATALMRARCGFDPGGLNDLSIAATFFAEEVLKYDGVWWEDLLDPASLSAPRGVIHLSALAHWKKTRVSGA